MTSVLSRSGCAGLQQTLRELVISDSGGISVVFRLCECRKLLLICVVRGMVLAWSV